MIGRDYRSKLSGQNVGRPPHQRKSTILVVGVLFFFSRGFVQIDSWRQRDDDARGLFLGRKILARFSYKFDGSAWDELT